ASWAMSFVSSFMLCAVAWDTSPVTVTLWPTCAASDTVLLFTSHELPSSAFRLNSLELSPCDRHPVTVRVSDFPLSESLAIAHTNTVHTRSRHKNTLFIVPPSFPTDRTEIRCLIAECWLSGLARGLNSAT